MDKLLENIYLFYETFEAFNTPNAQLLNSYMQKKNTINSGSVILT